jgi:heptosyltransferase I
VCIVLLSGIGDVVHGLPVAMALKRDRPSRQVVWVAQPAPAQVLEHHTAVDEIVVLRPGAGLEAVRTLRAVFRGKPCQVTLNMQRYARTLLPTYLSGAPVRVGMAPSRTRDGVRFINTMHTPEGPWRHTQDLFLEFLDLLGVDRSDPLEWGLTFSDEEEREAASFFAHIGDRPVVGLVLATANAKKDWLSDRYTALADALEEDFGYTVLLLGGPGDSDQRTAHFVADHGRRTPVWGLSDSVRRLIWSIRGCDLVISPDTGALHIAHALGVPVVGLFGHTNPWRVGPYERFHDLLVDRYSDPSETPDPSRYEPRHERMERITVTDVLERVRVAEHEYGVGAA